MRSASACSGATLRGRTVGRLCAALVVALSAPPAGAGRPVVAPPSKPGGADAENQRRAIAKRFDFLSSVYIRHLSTSDPVTRAIAVVSLSRMPSPKAAEAILTRLVSDRDPLVRLVAWQALLARAGCLAPEQIKSWESATRGMVRAKLFHGDLRIGLMDLLAASPVTPPKRKILLDTFARSSSLDSADVPTLIAMGRALRAWGDGRLVEDLIRALKSPHTAVRAELVLQAASVAPPWNRTPAAHDAYQQWWKEHKQASVDAGRKAAAYEQLRPQYLPAPMRPGEMDMKDMKWINELELPRFHLDQFDFAIAIDASRSMRAEIERLKRDVGIIFSAMRRVSREPRIGLTAFAPGRTVKHLPLTGRLDVLRAALQRVDIMGPAGEEEWAGALAQTMNASKWTRPGKYSKRAIVLISDEPVTDAQYARCLALAKQGAKAGFRIYAVMIRRLKKPLNNPLAEPFDRTPATVVDNPAMRKRLGLGKARKAKRKAKRGKKDRSWAYYDEITGATGGKAVDVQVPQGLLGTGLPLSAAKAAGGGKRKRTTLPQDPMGIAPVYPAGGPTSRVLTMVLVDSINPQYADRIEPFVHILVAYCQKDARHVPERRRWRPPGKMEPNHPQ